MTQQEESIDEKYKKLYKLRINELYKKHSSGQEDKNSQNHFGNIAKALDIMSNLPRSLCNEKYLQYQNTFTNI